MKMASHAPSPAAPYIEAFESRCLEETQTYYEAEVQRLLASMDLASYMVHALKRLEDEARRWGQHLDEWLLTCVLTWFTCAQSSRGVANNQHSQTHEAVRRDCDCRQPRPAHCRVQGTHLSLPLSLDAHLTVSCRATWSACRWRSCITPTSCSSDQHYSSLWWPSSASALWLRAWTSSMH
jgi:hypothetical protein